MSGDIFEFWAEMPIDAFVHPRDKKVFERMQHGFASDCLPGPYCGRLRTAPVVLLFLSPGLDQSDAAHGSNNQGREYYAAQRTGTRDLPTYEEHPSAYRWLKRVIGQFDIEYDRARSSIAILDIGAYKSKNFSDWGMLAALPSSRVCLDWAQTVLFPQAEAGERIVVCLRSPRYWGLKVGDVYGSLFCPGVTQAGAMLHGEMRETITRTVKRAVLGDIQQN